MKITCSCGWLSVHVHMISWHMNSSYRRQTTEYILRNN